MMHKFRDVRMCWLCNRSKRVSYRQVDFAAVHFSADVTAIPVTSWEEEEDIRIASCLSDSWSVSVLNFSPNRTRLYFNFGSAI